MRFSLSDIGLITLGLLMMTYGVRTYLQAESIRARSSARWSFGVPGVLGHRVQAALMTLFGLLGVITGVVDAIR